MVLTESRLGLKILMLSIQNIVLCMRNGFRIILLHRRFQFLKLIAFIVKLLMMLNGRLIAIINCTKFLLILLNHRR